MTTIDYELPEIKSCQDCGIPIIRRRDSDSYACHRCHLREETGFHRAQKRASALKTTLAFGRGLKHPQWDHITAPRHWP